MTMKTSTSSWLAASALATAAVAAMVWQPSVASESNQPLAPANKGVVAMSNARSAAPTVPVSGEAMAHSCAACHGTQGRLGDESFMPLAGMPQGQFVRSMVDFRQDKRPATLMGIVAKGFTDAEINAMGSYFAAVKPMSEGAKP